MADDFTNVLVRMPVEMKTKLTSHASESRRSVTQEIVMRLDASFQRHDRASAPLSTYPTTPVKPLLIDDRPPSCETQTDHDRAILSLFRQLPPEKQLSLLTLLKP